AQPGDEGRGSPVTVRDFADDSLTCQPPPVAAGQVGRNASLVDEDQFRWVQRWLSGAPGGSGLDYVGPILFGRVLELFFRVTFIRPSVLWITRGLTEIWCSFASHACSSASVISVSMF